MPCILLSQREMVLMEKLEPGKRTSKSLLPPLLPVELFPLIPSPSPGLAQAVKVQPVLTARSRGLEKFSRIAAREAILLLKPGIILSDEPGDL